MAAKPERMRIRLSDKESYQEIRTILAYESSVRGMTIGQVVSELIQQAVDTSTYPEEVRSRLREIADGSTRRAIEKSLNMMTADDDLVPGTDGAWHQGESPGDGPLGDQGCS